MKILNKTELDEWFNQARKDGHSLTAIKGIIEGATYDDGDPVIVPMNTAWRNVQTGEEFAIRYQI